jgi:S1-C subfamily serine protease
MTALVEFSQELSAIVAAVGQSVVAIRGDRYSASGIHWRSGQIVTSYESVNLEGKVHVILPTEQTVEVSVVGSDPTTDIALLQLPSSHELPVPTAAESSSLAVGNLVLALGRSLESGIFANLGIIQTLGGAWRSSSGGSIDQLIRVDINLNRRGAGGPLVNAEGKIIGFNTFGPRRSVLTIPASTVDRVITQLQAKGRIPRGYLGLRMQSVVIPESLQTQLALTSQRGLMVVSVEAGQAAEQAGVMLGDILIALGGQPIADNQVLQSFLDPQQVGKTLAMEVVRGGELRSLEVTVGER